MVVHAMCFFVVVVDEVGSIFAHGPCGLCVVGMLLGVWGIVVLVACILVTVASLLWGGGWGVWGVV